MQSVPSIKPLVHAFRGNFTKPSFANFSMLLMAWTLTPLRRTITGLIRCPLSGHLSGHGDAGRKKHFSVFHRFFSRARWNLDDLGRVLAGLLDTCIPKDVTLIVDDTLCRRSGPRILGAGMFHDPLASSTGGAKGKRVAFAFGLNFVVLSLWVPASFCHSGGIAVPILFRLYRSKRTCPEHLYHKRTQLAVELIGIAQHWLKDRTITVVADAEYACRTVLDGLPQGVHMVGPLPAGAQLHSPMVKRGGRGRPRRWGERLPRPRELAEDAGIPWRETTVVMYGSPVTMLTKEMIAVWKSSGHDRAVKVVLTRDPGGRLRDGFFFCTRSEASVAEMLGVYARRWEQEVCFRNVKQEMRLEDVANGFTRRQKRGRKRPGPQADKRHLPLASGRTGPFAFIAYGVTVVWYLKHGSPEQDISRVRRLLPWYRHKSSVSFADMLVAFRRQHIVEAFPRIQQKCALLDIPLDALPDWLMAA